VRVVPSPRIDRGTQDAREPPIIVIEGDDTVFSAAVDEMAQAGWHTVSGFGGRTPGSREVRTGVVRTAADAAEALLAVLAGAGAVIHGQSPRDVLDRLLDDLRHVRRVDVRYDAPAQAPDLPDDAWAILAILADGRTLGDAASTLGLSRRTADRRLAEARRAMRVDRTVEAVALARRLGRR